MDYSVCVCSRTPFKEIRCFAYARELMKQTVATTWQLFSNNSERSSSHHLRLIYFNIHVTAMRFGQFFVSRHYCSEQLVRIGRRTKLRSFRPPIYFLFVLDTTSIRDYYNNIIQRLVQFFFVFMCTKLINPNVYVQII